VRASVFTMRQYGTDMRTVKINGSTRTECVLKGIILGDYVSYYLALLNNLDPIEVWPIKTLKAEIEKRNNGKTEQNSHKENIRL